MNARPWFYSHSFHGNLGHYIEENAVVQAERPCAHCHKELPIGQSVYWRGALLHQECRVPFIVAQREASHD